MNEQLFELSNPRKEDTIEGWPHGSRRVTAYFTHESNKKGERIGRQTTGKPKFSRYYQQIRLVDGTDGKTHLLGHAGSHLSVLSCDMKLSDFAVFPNDPNFEKYMQFLSE